jgi:hypothetical protein
MSFQMLIKKINESFLAIHSFRPGFLQHVNDENKMVLNVKCVIRCRENLLGKLTCFFEN